MSTEDEHLAYGDYHARGANEHSGPSSERGILSDTVQQLRSHAGVSSLLGKLSGAVQDLSSDLTGRFSDLRVGAQAAAGAEHRFSSFAQTRDGNQAKWYVDGCGYFWAVSEAIEQAHESIWILDWWLSPELYLRRPPALNEQYRLDRLLKAAAERGVKINIIIYKEIPQALTLSSEYTKHTLEALHPNIAVFRHPDHLPDAKTLQSSFLSSLKQFSPSTESVAKLPTDALKALYGAQEDLILYWAHHEKLCLIDGDISFMGGLDLCYGRWDTNQHCLSDVHPASLDSIVFPGQDYNNARIMDFQNVSQPENNALDRTRSSRMGWSDISISLRGPVTADLQDHFIQRWNFIYRLKYDVRQDHRYAALALRSQQGNIPAQIPRPGFSPTHSQDQVQQASQQGQYHENYPPPPSLQAHTTANSPYFPGPPGHEPQLHQGLEINSVDSQAYPQTQQSFQSKPEEPPYFPPPPASAARGLDRPSKADTGDRGRYGHLQSLEERGFAAADKIGGKLHHAYNTYEKSSAGRRKPGDGSVSMQLVRSCARWSNGTPLEHSIQNAYINAIKSATAFVYIENQFFITATSPKQAPVMNRIGAAIVERVLRAARSGEKFKVVVLIPAVPGFAGDLRDESSLGTRAIMEFQYNSINRGGHSIMEEIAAEGFNPMEFIRVCWRGMNPTAKVARADELCSSTISAITIASTTIQSSKNSSRHMTSHTRM